jgi:hypothetical protein
MSDSASFGNGARQESRCDAMCLSRSVARMESRFGIDKERKKVVDDTVSAVENGKYQA